MAKAKSAPRRSSKTRRIHEQAFARDGFARLDEAWHRLSVEARRLYLAGLLAEAVAGEVHPQADQPRLRDELAAAGLPYVEPAKRGGAAARDEVLRDFDRRLELIVDFGVLRPSGASRVGEYLVAIYVPWQLTESLRRFATQLGMPAAQYDYRSLSLIFSGSWPGNAAKLLKNPTAVALVEALAKAPGPVPIAEVGALVPKAGADEARLALELLIEHAAVFEDVDPKTLDIVVGFLPEVGERIRRARTPGPPPKLVEVATPAALGPVTPPFLDDLHAVLLEVASEPPRVRNDGGLYAREFDRFIRHLESLPDWYVPFSGLTTDRRFELATTRAEFLGYLKEVVKGDVTRLEITPAGNDWMHASPERQAEAVFAAYRNVDGSTSRYGTIDGVIYPAEASLLGSWADHYYRGPFDDSRFLASMIGLRFVKRATSGGSYFEAKKSDALELRKSLLHAFESLKPGVYTTLRSFKAIYGCGPKNVLLCGRPASQIRVGLASRALPATDEYRDAAGEFLIQAIVHARLVPFGALRAALTETGELAVMPTPLLRAYFAGGTLADGTIHGVSGEAKVIVQPDFSIVVIGLNLAPVAALAPFTERQPGAKSGAQTLKLTRTSVNRAVAGGLDPAEIVARLRRLASHEVPPNVLKEVRGWADSVRRVAAATIAVIQCPDAETADRVAGLIKKSKRLGDTYVEVPPGSIGGPERERLLAQGIVLDGKWPTTSTSATTRTRRY